jgi:DNA integrity scanning protein DisA with diadenylate cyclase activity
MLTNSSIWDIIQRLLRALNPIQNIQAWLDIGLVTMMFYWLFRSLWGTRAVQLLQGIAVILVMMLFLGSVLPFTTMRWIFENVLQPALVVAIPVVFQPELRRLVESLGQTNRFQWLQFRRPTPSDTRLQMVKTVARAAQLLSQQNIGALIVFARMSVPLLMAIFHPNAPLHDMAVLIRGERILAANVVLPLSEEMGGARRYGTRHRAARGITEQSDAVVLVVSEETGAITVVNDGQMISQLNEERIVRILTGVLQIDTNADEVPA